MTRLRHPLRTLLLAAVAATLACGPRVDPDAWKAELGRRGNVFYRAVNELRLDDAAPLVNPALRERTSGPLDIPFLRARIEGRFVQVVPQDSEVDWRNDRAVVRVTRYVAYTEKTPVPAHTLRSLGTDEHRWLRIDGQWYFDGAASDNAP